MTEREQSELLVFEYGGTARSGKGTIVGHLEDIGDHIASEETGADYRAVTRALLAAGVIDPEMPADVITKTVLQQSEASLVDMVTRRAELMDEFGFESLYLPDVEGTVAHVSPIPLIRSSIKQGFQKRVEAVRDDDSKQILLVDGRNLGPVVEKVEGADLVMRTFVTCFLIEATRREAARNHDETVSFDDIFQKIKARNHSDAIRENDRVVPDSDAIDYWLDQDIIYETIGDRAKVMRVPHLKVIESFFEEHYFGVPRSGVGAAAVRAQQQILFDTTHFRAFSDPVAAMNRAAKGMFEEALDEHEA